MEKLKQYKKYKKSDINWLGNIPEHWSINKLKSIGRLYSGLTGKSGEDFKSENHVNNKNYIPFTNIANNFLINPKKLDKVILEPNEKQNLVLKNDLLFLMSSENFDDIGKTAILSQDIGEVYLNSFCKGFRVYDKNIDARFLNYLLSADVNRQQLIIEARGFTRINLKMQKVNDLTFYTPTALPEQTAIANFLDYKTAKIDRFIRKKKQLIKLLNEQKAGIINNAVTKGLNPKAKMKPSGIEWLGDIPAHWEVRKLKGILAKEKGALKPGPFGSDLKNEDIITSGYKVYNQRAVLDNNFVVSEECISPRKFEDLKVFEVLSGDILLTTRGTIGKCCIVPNNFEKGIIHPCIIRLRIDENKVSRQFVKLFIEQANAFKIALKINSNATTIDVIYGNTLKDIFFILPPLQEQSLIVFYVEKETAILNKAIATIEKEIALTQEYRKSLIAEAVTGKIDVRDYKVPEIVEEEELTDDTDDEVLEETTNDDEL